MSTTTIGTTWPTREEWARNRRELHTLPTITTEAAAYMTEEERLLLVDAMRQRCREVEPDSAQAIRRGIKRLKNGELPILKHDHAGAQDLLEPYLGKYQAAYQAAVEAAEEEAAQTPIDDDAWREELERRARLEGRGLEN